MGLKICIVDILFLDINSLILQYGYAIPPGVSQAVSVTFPVAYTTFYVPMVCLSTGGDRHYACVAKVDLTKVYITGWYGSDYKWWYAIGY